MRRTSDNKLPYGFEYEFQLGMHALGFAQDKMFANCAEGLHYWYGQGIKIFETDISITADDEFVCCHGFNSKGFEYLELDHVPDRPSLEWYMKQRLFSKSTTGLTPLSLADLFRFMSMHPDTIFMLDFTSYDEISTCKLWDYLNVCVQRYSVDAKRIIYEYYNRDMLAGTRGYDLEIQLQYCVNDEVEMGNSEELRNRSIEYIIDWLNDNHTSIISYPWKVAVEHLEELKKIKEAGLFVFSKTRNDILAPILKMCGVNVNLVDYVMTRQQEMELEGYRREYFAKYWKRAVKIFG